MFSVHCLVGLAGFTKHFWRAHVYYYDGDFGYTHQRWLLGVCVCVTGCLILVWPSHKLTGGKSGHQTCLILVGCQTFYAWLKLKMRKSGRFLYVNLLLVITRGYSQLFTGTSHRYNHKFVFQRLNVVLKSLINTEVITFRWYYVAQKLVWRTDVWAFPVTS